jgi:hypothetical protein
MIELRKAGKNEALGNVKSEKSKNCGEAFSKLQNVFIELVIGHLVKFSEMFFIYNMMHLGAINHENQSDSMYALKKSMVAMGHLHITSPFNVIVHLDMCKLLLANSLKSNISFNSFRETNHIHCTGKSKLRKVL